MLKKLLFLTVIAISFNACSVLRTIPHDDGAVVQLNTIQDNVNTIYSHPDFNQSEYSLLNNRIADLISYDSLRTSVTPIVKNVQELQKLVNDLEARHKARGSLNATLAGIYKDEITTMVNNILSSENKFK